MRNMRLDIKKIKHATNKTWTWMLQRDALIYFLFVGLATLFWWGRAMSSQREIDMRLPITYIDLPAQVVFDNPLPTHLKITLRDNGRILRQIQHTKPILVISIDNKLKKTDGKLQLSTELLRQKVQDILPGSTTIQQINPEDITADYHIESTKTVPIHLRADWRLENQYQLSTPPVLSPCVVDIYGKEEVISTIDSIATDSIFVDQLHDIVTKDVALLLPTGVRASFSTTTVVWKAEQFTEKSFDLPILVEGLPYGETMHPFPKMTTVTIRVGISHFAEVNAADLRAVCHYPNYEQSTLPVEIKTTNPHITQVRSSIREVEYIIERQL